MTVIVDAAPLVALGDANDPYFPRIDRLLKTVDGTLVIPAPVTAEQGGAFTLLPADS